MPDAPEQSIILDFWIVPDGSQDEFIGALERLFERLRALDGFLSGQILRGVNPSLFVSCATMRSAPERDAALSDPEVQAATRRIGGIAHPRPHAYTIARTFTPAA
jgi:hypothetical protein